MKNIVSGYIDGLRAKAFPITTINGVEDNSLTLSGFAKCLNGIVIEPFAATTANITMTLIVNNDVVIDSANVDFFTKDASNPRQYYEFFRPLTGQDTITLRIQDTAAQSIEVMLYYQNRPA
jgi:hypothetical protein